ncbi:hypothetical protein VTN00DRAFT_2045 [Thermoascus crustaceus]|uniref:uncharacterized protein n=1 Tax=Thermoascus crustaceus TaxID=5088 RepID=UPI00374427E2
MSAVIRGWNPITPVAKGSIPENQGDSGCYPYREEKCCMKEWICKCHTGVFYEYNGIAACQPPGAILGPDAQSIPGDHDIKELETLMRHKPDADIHEMPGS